MKKIIDHYKPRTGIVTKEYPSGSLKVKWHYDPCGEIWLYKRELSKKIPKAPEFQRYEVIEMPTTSFFKNIDGIKYRRRDLSKNDYLRRPRADKRSARED